MAKWPPPYDPAIAALSWIESGAETLADACEISQAAMDAEIANACVKFLAKMAVAQDPDLFRAALNRRLTNEMRRQRRLSKSTKGTA